MLVNYGFCFPGNRYETFSFNVRTDVKGTKNLTVKQVLKKTDDIKQCQTIQFKQDLIIDMLMIYLRHTLKTSFYLNNAKKTVPITQLTDIAFERYCLEFYL